MFWFAGEIMSIFEKYYISFNLVIACYYEAGSPPTHLLVRLPPSLPADLSASLSLRRLSFRSDRTYSNQVSM